MWERQALCLCSGPTEVCWHLQAAGLYPTEPEHRSVPLHAQNTWWAGAGGGKLAVL